MAAPGHPATCNWRSGLSSEGAPLGRKYTRHVGTGLALHCIASSGFESAVNIRTAGGHGSSCTLTEDRAACELLICPAQPDEARAKHAARYVYGAAPGQHRALRQPARPQRLRRPHGGAEAQEQARHLCARSLEKHLGMIEPL